MIGLFEAMGQFALVLLGTGVMALLILSFVGTSRD